MHAPLPKLPAKMPAERPRSRQYKPRKMSRKNYNPRGHVLHVVAPGLEIARERPRKGETVTAFLRRTGWAYRDPKYGWQFRKRLPTILEVNGEAVLRKDWRRTKIAANDNVRFVSFPRGGGGGKQGKQVLGLVALVAVAAFAAWAGPALAAGLGLTGATETVVGGLVTGAIGLGGALLINALVAPKTGATNDPNATTDQIYTAAAQGNRARLGQPLPVWYGRNKDYPDFAATPWGEFQGNDQYLNVLLSVTMGSMKYEQLTISDTPFWTPEGGVSSTFSSAQVAFYEPNAPVTLFPVNVAQSDEVNGQQLPHDYGWVGPYVANPPDTEAYRLAVDYVFPAGCYSTNDEGKTVAFSVTLVAEYQPVNNAGAPIGGWSTLGTVTKSYASRSPIRETMLATVGSGRYQVRFRRTSAVPADNKGAADVVWAGLRAFLQGDNRFPVSTVAIRIKATETTQGSFKFGVIGTRKLPVWNGSTFVTQATRNAAWALLDMATNSQYGAEINSSKIDFNTLVNHATGCANRGDKFDYVFKSAVAVPEALDTALIPSRARHMWLGDTLSLVRDEWSTVPTMMLTDREIVRNSTSLEYTMLGDEDPDAVIIEYIDEDTWLPATVQYPQNGQFFTASRPETKRVNGIVNRSHAYREAAFYYLCSIYRRETGSIGCEYEGRAITMGATLRLQSELPQNYGFAGAVVDRSSNTLTLDPAPVWASGQQHYIRLRRQNGREFGPVKVSKGANDSLAVLDSSDLATVEGQQEIVLADVLARASSGEYPSYALGTADNQSKLVKVLTGQPNGETFTLSIVVDDERVHTTDLGDPPVLPVGQFPKNDNIPLVVGLNARFGQGVAEPQLAASWFPTAGAFYYRAEVSYDSGNSWIEVYEGVDTKFEKFVTYGGLALRVQAVGQFPGPWAEVPVAAPTIQIMDNTVALNSLIEGIRYQVAQLQNQHSDRLNDIEQLISSIAANQDARNWNDKQDVKVELKSISGDLSASVSQVMTVATDTEAALAQYKIDVNSALSASGYANLTEAFTTIATADGKLAATWQMQSDVNGHISSMKSYNDGTVSSIVFVATEFKFSLPGVAGGAPQDFIVAGTVGGVPTMGIAGNFLLDGVLTARMMNVGSLSAITADIGEVTAGKLRSNDNKFIIDLNNRYFEVWD